MCYGDLDYGTYGYYRHFMEQAAEDDARLKERARQQMDAMDGEQ